jgi:UrcA family protein
MKSLIILATAVVAAGGLSPAARADASLRPRSVTVRYGDLNTNSTAGATVLYQRIKTAAETVCSDMGPSRSLSLLSRYSGCVSGAIRAAVAQVNSPAVSEYAATRGIVPARIPNKVKFARND